MLDAKNGTLVQAHISFAAPDPCRLVVPPIELWPIVRAYIVIRADKSPHLESGATPDWPFTLALKLRTRAVEVVRLYRHVCVAFMVCRYVCTHMCRHAYDYVA